ncbi:hypothetical protein [Nonomuraea sp. NPDC049141]|uniref:hypothetical protein n=1 Tax=Nonomuraea sp. NPDC049141 TaxID=3155500 RepID=UPI00340E740D
MDGSFAESYAQVARERVADIPVPARYAFPDVLIEDGYGVRIVPSTPDNPKPVLTIGDRVILAGARGVMQGIVAVEVAQAHLATRERRSAEAAGGWAFPLIVCSAVLLGLGLLGAVTWFIALGGLGMTGGMLGVRPRLAGAQAMRERIFEADDLAVDWVGRQAVVDSLRWRAEQAEPESQPGPLGARFATPTIKERIAHLGA